MNFKKLAQTNLILVAGIGLTVAAAMLVAPAISRADTMYVSYAAGNTVEKFDTLSGVGTVFATNGLNSPVGLAFDSAGNLYVGKYNSDIVEKFDTNGNSSVFTTTGLSAPLGLTFDSAGFLYVANWGNNTIEKFDTNGNGSLFANGASGLDAPIGLIFDSAGNLYVANWVGNTIEKFDTNGNGSVFASSGLNGPQGLAFDSAGNLYVANSGGGNQETPGSGSIEKFTPDGIGSVFASGLYFPFGLAFDSAGNLYATSRGNSDNLIYKFTPGGVQSVFANTPGTYPEFIVIKPGLGSNTNPPSITSQPQPATVTISNNASFSVTATGTALLHYQWYFNSTNISGATSSSLTISNVVQTNLGLYSVVVTNALGSATSSNAMLSMYPYIYQPFTGVITDWGQNPTLSVQALGTGPLSYQWFDNGVAVQNATNQTLTLTSIQFTNAGLYSVVVSDSFGSVTNAPAQVVVDPAGVSLGLYPGITVTGTVGYTYNIQATSNLSSTNTWTTMATLTLQQPVQLWVDTNDNTTLHTNAARFYRVVPGP